MSDDEPFLRRRTIQEDEEVEILDEIQQQKVIDEIKTDYDQITADQKYCIVVFGMLFFVSMSITSFFTQDYVFYFLPGLAAGVLSALILFRPDWAVTVSLSIETLALLGLVQRWAMEPLLFVLGVHGGYAVLLIGRIFSERFTRSIPRKIRHLESLKYSVKLA
jgi:hypothetical protein